MFQLHPTAADGDERQLFPLVFIELKRSTRCVFQPEVTSTDLDALN